MLSLQRLTIRDGSTSNPGGGIYSTGTLLAVDCTITGNATQSAGGGVMLFGGVADLLRCTLSGNTAAFSDGAMAHQIDARTTLTNCTIADNRATGPNGRGGISVLWGSMDLRHCTITRNIGTGAGGGIYLQSSAIVRLERSIVAGNTAPSRRDIYANGATLTATGPSLIGSNQTVTTQFPTGLLAGTAASPLNALLAPLGDYGGATFTMALKPGSPARHAATGSTILADQRRFPLVGTPDLGAYEADTLDRNFNAFIYETLPASTPNAQYAATFDFDGDGANNEGEYLAGTIVTSPAGVFRVTAFTGNPGDLILSFPSVVGRHYQLEESTNLIAWTPIISGLPGTGVVITLGLGSSQPRYFVRVRVGP